jgi:hypothetical protein
VTREVPRDGDCTILRNPEHASIEEQMMHAAECEPILQLIRAVQGPPPNVRSFETYDVSTESALVAAHCTSVLIREENIFSKLLRSSALLSDGNDAFEIRTFEIQPHSASDLSMEGLRKVLFEKVTSAPHEKCWVADERVGEFRFELPNCIQPTQ